MGSRTMRMVLALGAAVLGVTVLLAGCALPNVAPDFALQDSGNRGIVVVALGRTGAAHFDLSASIVPLGGGSSRTVVVDDGPTPKDFGRIVIPPPGSDATDLGYVPAANPLERVVVAALPAGDYEICNIQGYAPRFAGPAIDPFTINSDPLALRFAVRAGQVTYLGSVVFVFPPWMALGHPWGPLRVLATDTHDRDEKLLRERYPKLGGALPERSLANIPDPARVFRYYSFLSHSGSSKD